MKKYLKCLTRVTKKIKKRHKKSQKVIKKMEYNAHLDTPKLILKIYQGNLKRKKGLTDIQVKVSEKMIKEAKLDIKRNKKRKHKKFTKKDMGLVKTYNRELRNEIVKECQ